MTLEDPLLTPEEVAEQLRFSRQWVYTLIKQGRIRAIKSKRAIRVRQSAVDEFLRGLGDDTITAAPATPRKRRARK